MLSRINNLIQSFSDLSMSSVVYSVHNYYSLNTIEDMHKSEKCIYCFYNINFLILCLFNF